MRQKAVVAHDKKNASDAAKGKKTPQELRAEMEKERREMVQRKQEELKVMMMVITTCHTSGSGDSRMTRVIDHLVCIILSPFWLRQKEMEERAAKGESFAMMKALYAVYSKEMEEVSSGSSSSDPHGLLSMTT